jgi:hypothetical protein
MKRLLDRIPLPGLPRVLPGLIQLMDQAKDALNADFRGGRNLPN